MPTSKAIQQKLTLYESTIASLAPAPEDLAYIHPVFVQCFLPIRPSHVGGQHEYSRSNGKWTLTISSGHILNPEDDEAPPIRASIPAGGKARLILAYLNDRAYRTKCATIELGKSMRDWMDRAGMPSCGSNHKALSREIQNVLAAHFTIIERTDTRKSLRNAQIAKQIDFWHQSAPHQGSFWQPEVTLTSDYFNAVMERQMPVDYRVYAALHKTPVAMDLYAWLVYRLARLNHDTRLPLNEVQLLFGQGYAPGAKGTKNFVQNLRKKLLPKVLTYYPDANVELEKNSLLLRPSPPAFPRDMLSKRSVLPHIRRPSLSKGELTRAKINNRSRSTTHLQNE